MLQSGFYLMDCMEGMAQFPDKFFELAIVDPPYGININHNMGRRKGDKHSDYKKVKWDDEAPPLEYFQELFRVSQNQIIWGANHFIDRIMKPSACWLIWDKGFSEDVSFASFEMAWTSFDSAAKRVLLPSSQIDRIHPTQKPIALYKWLLNNYAKPGDKIIDTHVGSASSLIACHRMGFQYWGFEIDADYFKAATDRLEWATAQVGFFEPAQTTKPEQIGFGLDGG